MMSHKQTPYNPVVSQGPGYEMTPYRSQPPVPPGPIIQQPVQADWMSMPQGLRNCPPGLEYLSLIDSLLIHQTIDVLEVVVGYERNNRYIIKNSVGQKVYFAKEETDCCTRNCWGSMRPFDMKILDNFENEVMHLYRPLACSGCCFPCCLQTLEVFSPPGTLIGTVEEVWTFCKPCFVVKDANNDVLLKIKGPICTCACFSDIDFFINSKDSSMEVGKITKQWTGFFREAYTDADNFGVKFPMDLDVKVKALLLAATFLIDFMYFESSQK
ncbi:phospholipid scramblase 1-like [Epargyreus clarus]|uniref:phospholipid scramblase 1-like n=1 Tax=Epargyreus clarus TaxID=520877 RepID=UPI003C302745